MWSARNSTGSRLRPADDLSRAPAAGALAAAEDARRIAAPLTSSAHANSAGAPRCRPLTTGTGAGPTPANGSHTYIDTVAKLTWPAEGFGGRRLAAESLSCGLGNLNLVENFAGLSVLLFAADQRFYSLPLVLSLTFAARRSLLATCSVSPFVHA